MASTWTTERYPQFAESLQRLTEQHRELTDEPLHLALAYEPGPDRNQRDIYLLEVIGSAIDTGPNSERELFEVTYTPTSGFPLNADQNLHLILTDPKEMQRAIREGWPSAREIVSAINHGDYRVLFSDPTGDRFLREVRVPAEAAVHG